jgi:hypothetical protein
LVPIVVGEVWDVLLGPKALLMRRVVEFRTFVCVDHGCSPSKLPESGPEVWVSALKASGQYDGPSMPKRGPTGSSAVSSSSVDAGIDNLSFLPDGVVFAGSCCKGAIVV